MSDRDEKGLFLPGCQIWKMIKTRSGPAKFKTPEELWDACVGYFDWVAENPLMEDNIISYQGAASHEPVAKMRAMTLKALCLFIGISFETWTQWRKNRDDLKEVIEAVESIIWQSKFEGAAAGLLNQAIICRELGLADKSELSADVKVRTLADFYATGDDEQADT